MSTCKTASLACRTFLKMESSKINTMFPTTSPRKVSKEFLKFSLYVEKIDLKLDLGNKKRPKSVILREKKIIFVSPARKLIFSLKHSSLKVLAGNNHVRPGKNYKLRRFTSKSPKNDFSDKKF